MKSQGQAGVANRDSIHGLALLYQVQSEHLASLRLKLAKIPALAASLDDHFSESLLTVTAAFGESAFAEIGGLVPPHNTLSLPAFEYSKTPLTILPVDIAIVIRSERYDSCFFAARVIGEWLSNDVVMMTDVSFFHYLDNRNLFGFKCWRDTLVGPERHSLLELEASHEPRLDQGSYLVLQHNRIDQKAWQQLLPEQQEQIIGQKKLSGERIATDKPSHASKVTASLGHALIWHQLPIANIRESEHLDLLWSNDPQSVFEWLAERIEDRVDGFYDPLLDYQENLLSAAFYVPPRPWFEQLKERV